MKKWIGFVLAVLLTGVAMTTQAQIRKMPSAVTNGFKEKFPEATDVSWKDKLSSWQASFTLKGIETEAWFTSKGEWKETNQPLEFSNLPEDVKTGLSKSRYSEWTPGEVTVIWKKDKPLEYRIYVEKSSLVQKKYLHFNEKGVLQKEIQSI
ncbi:hypothetical protein HNQ91_004495 [Filimonas zeae]|nr:PepSY-like domain-containing protein [Filimonas zeae]MDR6341422.1 hypothetical protein [Filimonas zeae]